MVTLDFFFFFMIGVFAVIGGLRGWAKELLVAFSVVLAIFIIAVVELLVPDLITDIGRSSVSYFWVRTLLLFGLVFFGYQTPNIPRLGGARFVRERLQDVLLGAVLGALNGFLVMSTLWIYLHEARYPFDKITAPIAGDWMSGGAFALISWLVANQLRGTPLYVTVALALLFILVVLI
jgi:uncharacterized membrane protein required for colicin V production